MKSMVIAFALLLATFSQASYATQQTDVLGSQRLVILNWPDYLPESVIQSFEKKYNAKINLFFFESDEKKDYLLSTTQARGYDLIISSLFRTKSYIGRGWLQPIPDNKFTNHQNLAPRWQQTYQQTQSHCAPYLWGTLGVIYRKDKVKKPIATWTDFFQPQPALSGRIKLLSDSRDTIGMALKSLGYSSNTNVHEQVTQAGDLLRAQLGHVSDYGALELSKKSLLITGDIWMAMAYNGDAQLLMSMSDKLDYIVPEEGSGLWLDCITLAKQASNPELALKFINYIHQGEVAAQISESLYYTSTNKKAIPYLSKAFLDNKTIHPPENVLQTSEFHQNLLPSIEKQFHTLYSQLTFELKRKQNKRVR